MFPSTVEIKRLFLFVLAAKIFILGVFLVAFGEDRLVWADSPLYIDLGRNIWLGNGLAITASDGSAVLNTRFMPLYPAAIGFFSLWPHGLIVVSLLQAAAAASIAVFVYKSGLFFLPHRGALGVALVATFEPLISAMHILIMPETLFVLFLMGFIYFFLSYWRYLGNPTLFFLGIALFLLTLAAYTKPAALYLAIFPILFLVFAKREYMHAGIFAATFILAFVPWMMRNAAVGGNFAVTNDDTGNICGWTLHGVIATKYGVDPTDWSTTWGSPELLLAQKKCTSPAAALHLFLTEYPRAFVKTMTLATLSYLTNDGYSVFFEKPQEEQVKPHHNFLTPAVFAMRDWREKLRAALSEFSALERTIILAGKVFWCGVLVSALYGSFLLLRNPTQRVPALFLVFIVFYFISATVFSTAYGAGSRLRYPIAALLLIFAAYGILHAVPRHLRNLRV